MKAIIEEIKGPFDGAYEDNLLLFILRDENKNAVNWYQSTKRPETVIKARIGHILEGLVMEENDRKHIPNYEKSQLRIINRQFNLLDNE